MGKEGFVRPLTLEIDKKVWEKFKESVDRGTTLNDAICLLIHEFVEKGNRRINLRKAR